MRIIPAIDLIDGKCVRLTKGDYSTSKTYNEDPLEVAKAFEDHGIRFLHVVDLDGAKGKGLVNQKTLQRICTQTSLHVDFGGGIKQEPDLKTAFECGAKQVTLGSIAAQKKELVLEWLHIFGSSKLILGADCRNRKIATNGWLTDSDLDVVDFINDYHASGMSTCICTDIAKDGMLQGPSTKLYADIIEAVEIDLIASGGIASLADVQQVKDAGCSGVIIGKAIYEGYIQLKDLEKLC